MIRLNIVELSDLGDETVLNQQILPRTIEGGVDVCNLRLLYKDLHIDRCGKMQNRVKIVNFKHDNKEKQNPVPSTGSCTVMGLLMHCQYAFQIRQAPVV